jgi:hypothetical protein
VASSCEHGNESSGFIKGGKFFDYLSALLVSQEGLYSMELVTYFDTVIFQILTAASMKMTVFWNVAPCSLVEIDRRFRDSYCLHHQGDPSRQPF